MKIGIIGGGAAGLLAAIYSKSDNNEVIVFERNKECGKKLLATGNGRCNYWNDDQSLCHYQSMTPDLISQFIDKETEILVLDFFNKIGIISKIKNGYYYPFSNQAVTIKEAILKAVKDKNITIRNDCLVNSIKYSNNRFIVCTSDEEVIVDKFVIATGSKAAPKTGTDGMGYEILNKLGHAIIKPLPALVQLKGNGNYFNIWTGVRTDAKVALYEDGIKVRTEEGELQLTNYGISGICIFNLSNQVARGLDENKKEDIYIDFMPFIEIDKKEWFIKQTNLTNKNIYELLMSILNEKIVKVIFELSNLNKNKSFNDMNEEEQQLLITYCTNFKVEIIGTNTYNEAQVCSGGISLNEIDLNTMESKIINNLYIVGELLDITGDCGGYNLGIAWRSGIKAGMAIRGIK